MFVCWLVDVTEFECDRSIIKVIICVHLISENTAPMSEMVVDVPSSVDYHHQ